MEDPMLKDGTRIEADCGFNAVAGRLVGDHEDLDGIVTLRDEMDNEVIRLNGWLWCIEVVEDEPPPAE